MMIELADVPVPIGFHIDELHLVDFADILVGIQSDGVGDNGVARLGIMLDNASRCLRGAPRETTSQNADG